MNFCARLVLKNLNKSCTIEKILFNTKNILSGLNLQYFQHSNLITAASRKVSSISTY